MIKPSWPEPEQAKLIAKASAFEGCSETTLQRICDEGDIIRFSIGHVLSSAVFIPDRVLLILKGSARLIGKHRGQLNSLAHLGVGNIIGLASLLRAEPCEEVCASTEVEAWSIPDTLISEIYKDDDFFRQWCTKTVFPGELAILLDELISNSETSAYAVRDILGEVLPLTRSIEPTLENFEENADTIAFISSKNTSANINSILSPTQGIPENRGTFNLRILSIPRKIVEKIKANNPENEISSPTYSEDDKVNESFPSRTVLELDGKNKQESITLISGNGILEESLACLRMICEIMKLPFRRDSIEKSIREVLNRGIKPSQPMFGQLVASMGLMATGAKVPASMCTRMNVPCLLEWVEGWGVVVRSDSNGFLVAHPRLGWLELSPTEIEEKAPEGVNIILIQRTNDTPNARFDFGWFLPAIQRYKSTLLLVLCSSFIVQLFTLANPLLIQVVIDKVISQRSLDTLQVLGIALFAVTIFEGILGTLRTFLFTDTTNRIDMRLGAEVIDHLLRLPIGYFDRRPVGELGTRIAELEKIRNFLTGEALTTIIDAAFSVIYIIVMALYSWILTIIALIVVPIQVAITFFGAPLFRRQFRQAAEENAKTQSHLVEVLTGIQTVKAQNVEMVSRWKWQERYSKYISRSFEKTITGTALSQTSQVLQKLSQLMVLWVGATLVLSGDLSLGQLIAFRIISGYVTQPLLRLSTIWQRIQELRVSFERLADIVDATEESTNVDKGKIPLPPVFGNIKFENIEFSFQPGATKVLKNIDLEIPAGKFVGVVGQSGSGKSTLMKLLPRLYSPNEGRILIDGYDIDKVELYSLRRQIGIVPQEPLLFTGSVSENISLTDPNASSESIKTSCEIACAHEFIMDLPAGYSTELGERGSSLSGGQRQRLAIARTLLNRPKLLVMDEATSALDYDTERRVCQNLRESLGGCTVFFVTHRLSTVRNADIILMMHQGAVVEVGSHQELIDLRGRYYALYRQQDAG